MRQEASFFEGHDPRLIYIAKRLKESLAVELLLCENGVEYGVETDQYRGGLVFTSERTGAFFYVLPGAEETARNLLTQNGYRPPDSA
ncbi:MAG TPA: hypothetical protein VGL72_27395 [Bryobacteraceae bacterium]|jgi:hypothetical protein